MIEDEARQALRHYADLAEAHVSPFGGGLINDTFLVEQAGQRWILQRVNPIFSARIHENVEAVTRHLSERGFVTPRLVRTMEQTSYVTLPNADRWRLMTFVEGATFDAVQSTAQARSAAVLVGRVHAALDELDYEFKDMRLGVHDTPAHLATLRRAVAERASHALAQPVSALAAEIFAAAGALEPLPQLADRVSHGDLKFNNIRFAGPEAPDSEQAVCLIDLDTVGPMHLGYEIGDALRSWCNRGGEDRTRAEFDLGVWEASLEGYVEGIGRPLSGAEARSIALGVEWVSLELSARFAADALLESYFGWDPSAYATRGEHNLARAHGQWALFEAARHTHAARAKLLGVP